MKVNVGRLNKRISIIRVDKQQDPAGYWTGQDTIVRTCWASFQRTSGKELSKNHADYTEIMVRFLIRTPPTPISRKMLVLYAGQRYEIQYVNDYGDAGEFTELLCRQLKTGG